MKNNRNVNHRSVVSQLTSMGIAVDVRIVVRDISSESAASLERDRISLYGVENLTNMNRGGGGVIKHSPEALAKISATSKGRRVQLGRKRTSETKERLRELGIASIETFKKYSVMGPKSLSKRVVCLDDGLEFSSASSAARHYGIAKSAVIEVCLERKYRHTAGGRKFSYVTKDVA